jgi:hypothetical protein
MSDGGAIAPAISPRLPRSALLHRALAAWPLSAVPAHPRNRRGQAVVRFGRGRQNRRVVPQRTTEEGSGGEVRASSMMRRMVRAHRPH